MADALPTPEDLVTAGLYDPDAPGAEDRLAALTFLLERGATLEHLRVAGDVGRVYSAVSLAVLWPDGGFLTVAEVAEAAAMDEAELRALRMLTGLPDPGDAALCPPEEVEIWRTLQLGDALFGAGPMRHMLRAMGSSAATVAEAAVALALPLVPLQQVSERAYVERAHEAAQSLVVVPQALDVLLRLHVLAAGDRLLRAETGDDDLPRFTVGFVDLVASTERTAGLDAEELAGSVADFARVAAGAASTHRTRLVKLLGDEAMFVDRDAARVAATVVTTVAGVSRHADLGQARGGVATGPVLPSEGDYFGPGANLAHRVVDEASPGQVVADRPTAEAAGWPLDAGRTVRLRGIAEPQELRAAPAATTPAT